MRNEGWMGRKGDADCSVENPNLFAAGGYLSMHDQTRKIPNEACSACTLARPGGSSALCAPLQSQEIYTTTALCVPGAQDLLQSRLPQTHGHPGGFRRPADLPWID